MRMLLKLARGLRWSSTRRSVLGRSQVWVSLFNDQVSSIDPSLLHRIYCHVPRMLLGSPMPPDDKPTCSCLQRAAIRFTQGWHAHVKHCHLDHTPLYYGRTLHVALESAGTNDNHRLSSAEC